VVTKKESRTLDELLAEQQKLEALIEERRAAESAEVLAHIHEAIEKYGFTAEQLFPTKKKRNVKPSTGEPKYRDPKTGATWVGRGKPPVWIQGKTAEEKEKFLIQK
jgi:DNA-binding protein H-NS